MRARVGWMGVWAEGEGIRAKDLKGGTKGRRVEDKWA